MRKATLVLATSVAFLVSGAAFAVTGTRTGTVSSAADLIKNGTIADAAGNLRVQSAPISGTYIPAGASASTEVAVATRTAGTIAKSAVSTAMKTAIRANAYAAAASAAINAATSAVGWVMKDGTYSKPIESPTSNPNDYYWTGTYSNARGPTPKDACAAGGNLWAQANGYTYISATTSYVGVTTYSCTITYLNEVKVQKTRELSNASRAGSGCTSPAYYSTAYAACVSATYTPVTDADFNDLGDWVQQKDGTFVRQAAIDSCSLAVNPEACFQTIVPDRSITGPATVTGPPVTTSKTVSTTAPDGTVSTGTSTTTTTPASNVTYNNNTTNNITYNTYDKTSTKNPDGSTTETTSDEGPPNVPDLTSTAFGPLDGLPADIIDTGAKGSSLPFGSWFSMGGQCKEHTFQLPVVGALTTSYCPIHEAYVRPFLYFMFSVWTSIYCFQIWRESTVRVRIL